MDVKATMKEVAISVQSHKVLKRSKKQPLKAWSLRRAHLMKRVKKMVVNHRLKMGPRKISRRTMMTMTKRQVDKDSTRMTYAYASLRRNAKSSHESGSRSSISTSAI